MSRMSQYGIRLPAPKLGLPSHLVDDESLFKWLHSIAPNPDYDKSYLAWRGRGNELETAIRQLSLSWRIERSRADDLERAVEILEAQVRELRELRDRTLIARVRAFFRSKGGRQ